MGSEARLQRVLMLLAVLQSGRYLNAPQLAEHCQVSRRTIYRDMNTLRDSVIDIRFDEQRQGYTLAEQSFLPATDFTIEEALSLLMLCDQGSDVPFQHAARSAGLKLLSSLPRNLREYVGELSEAIVLKLDPHNPLEQSREYYDQIALALRQRKQVRIRYGSLTENQELQTLLSPYRMLFMRRSWYVIGRSSVHREVRTFNLGRILSAETLDSTCTIPERFSLSSYLGNAWQLIREPGPDHQVVVRFQPLVATNVAEVRWHKTQELIWNADGTLDFHVTVSSLKEIIWWVLGYGNQAEVLQPSELRDQIRQHVSHLRAMYGED